MPVEIITLFGGSLAGFLFKMMAKSSENRHKEFQMALKAQEQADKSAENAAKRDASNGGMWTRRVIVLCILFGVILAPLIATLMSIPVIIEVDQVKPIFFGLLGNRSEKLFVEVFGYVLIPEIRQALTAIIGFYFGQATVK